MSDETTQFILGDAAADATAEGRRGLRRRRKKRKDERTLTHCENCGAQLTGEFCAQCGQHAIDYRRSLWRVLVDAADSFLNWDTKFLSSMWVLLTRPWKLTNDFNAGRRARYVHPLRLYLLASIAFFLMIKMVNLNNGGPIVLGPQDRTEISNALAKLSAPDSVLTPEQRAKVDAVRARLTEGTGAITDQERDEMKELIGSAFASKLTDKIQRRERARLKAALARIPETPEAPSPPPIPGAENAEASPALSIAIPKKPPKSPGIHFGDDENRPKTPFEEWLSNRVKDKMGGGGEKAKLFLETLRNNIPTMMLCCIPLFALVLKMLYIRKGRYYVEHLVYALHIHTFAYLGALLITFIGLGLAHWSNVARALVCTFLGFAMFVLVFLSIRRVYREGWFFTTFKFLLGGVVYFVILVCAVGITAFVTLLLPE
ncbi:MAG: DUF3667 domain-containing protein [Chthoniobacterales bacterium]